MSMGASIVRARASTRPLPLDVAADINIDAARLHLRDDDPAALRHSIKRAYSYFKAIRDVLKDLEENNDGK